MRNLKHLKGTSTVLAAGLGLGMLAPLAVLPFMVSCSAPSKDKIDNLHPTISAFWVTNNPREDFLKTDKQVNTLTVSKGDAVYLLPRFSTPNGAAVIEPSLGTVTSNVLVPAGTVNQTTVYTLKVTTEKGETITQTATVTAVDLPDATLTAPTTVVRNTGGLTASVPDVAGCTYTWSVSAGHIDSGNGTHAITFTSGDADGLGGSKPMTISVTVTNAAGKSAPASKVITVTSKVPTSFNYAANPASYYMNVPIAANTPVLAGGDPVSFAIAPALPAGLLFDTATGVISGTPSAITPSATYQVTATNTGGSISTNLVMTVNPQPAVTFTASPAKIGPNGGSILSWNVDNTVNSITVDQGVQTTALDTTTVKSGSFNVSPTSTTTYTLTANLAAGGTYEAPATVTVDTTALAINTFTSEQPLVQFGGSTKLDWTLAGTPNTLTLDGASVLGANPVAVMPVRRQTYTLTAANGAGTVSKTLTVPARGLDLVAGSYAGPGAIDAVGALAAFNQPRQIAADAAGNIYVADSGNHIIRLISTSGAVSTIAGQVGQGSFTDGVQGVDQPTFNAPRGIAVTKDGSLVFVYDAQNKSIRKLAKSGSTWTVSTVATFTSNAGYGQLTMDPTDQYLVIADSAANKIKVLRVSDNALIDYAGTGGYATKVDVTNALLSTATFDSPEGIAFAPNGNWFYVTDAYSAIGTVRAISWNTATLTTTPMTVPTGTVLTLVGTTGTTFTAKGFADGPGSSALLNGPVALATDAAGNLYISEMYNNVVRKVTGIGATPAAGACTVSTIAGTIPGGTSSAPVAVSGSDDGAALSAKFNGPNGIVVVGSDIYLGDTNNASIRKVSGGAVSTPFGTSRQSGLTDASTGAAVRFSAPQGVAFYGGKAYVADTGNKVLRVVDQNTGATSTVAAAFTSIRGVAAASNGNIFVTDIGTTAATKALYQVNPATGALTAIMTGLVNPTNVTVSPSNPNLLYIVDANAVVEITIVRDTNGAFVSASKTKVIGLETTASGSLVDDPNPANARFKMNGFFCGLAVDASGNIYVGDEGNQVIRMIAAGTYATTTVAGTGTTLGYRDGAANASRFYYPMGLALVGTKLYIADEMNHAVRVLDLSNNTVSTVVGLSVNYTGTNPGYPGKIGAIPGTLTGAGLYNPFGLAVNSDGDLLVCTADAIMQITAP